MGKRKKTSNDKEIDAAIGGEIKGLKNPFTRILKRKKTDTDTAALVDRTVVYGRAGINSDIDTRLPKRGRGNGSILIAETKAMERNRRLAEQQGERRLASVKARDHSLENEVQPSPEGELQNNILQHPELDSQRFDGIDPNLNPEPPLNTEARREFDNERREQEQEKQLRLGNMPKFSTAPTPRGPS